MQATGPDHEADLNDPMGQGDRSRVRGVVTEKCTHRVSTRVMMWA